MGNTQTSMLEKAIELMQQKRTSQPISKIIEEVLESKGLDDPQGELAAQLYMDITTSAKFVFMGNDEWDLKTRQSLDEWDKDGSAFNVGVEEEEDDGITSKDYDFEDQDESEEEDSEDNEDDDDEDYQDDEYNDDEELDDTELERDEFVTDTYSEDDDDDDMDEDSYNDIMDKYEDMYDDK